MKQFMLLHVGFETPTPEIMQAWRNWFEENGERTLENVGLRNGREITKTGARALAMGSETLTGYTIINARDLDEAEGSRDRTRLSAAFASTNSSGTRPDCSTGVGPRGANQAIDLLHIPATLK